MIPSKKKWGTRQILGWVLGPTSLITTFLLAPPTDLDLPGWKTMGVAIWMAVWWICEPVPIAATALLPMVLFPILGLGTIQETCEP